MSLIIYCQWCRKKLTEPGALLFSPPDMFGKCLKTHVCAECYKEHLLPPKMITRIFKPRHCPNHSNCIENVHSSISSRCIAECSFQRSDEFLNRLLDRFEGAYQVHWVAGAWKTNMWV